MTEYSNKGLLPAGLQDALPPDAEWEAHVIERLLGLFDRHGYRRVKPPLIEFEETLLAASGKPLAPQMFRVMDPVSQRMLAVRPDITLQVARIAETRLADAPRPLRLSYAGQVLRVRGTQLRPERQFAQAGLELIGAASLAADVEVVLLAAEALADLGVRHGSIDLTQPMLVPAVCRGIGLTPAQAEAARLALDHKDAGALATAVGDKAPVLNKLLAATGPAEKVMAKLSALALPKEAKAQVTELGDLVRRVAEAAPTLTLTIDAGEFRNFEYHTGISFTLFARDVAGELGRGGRYLGGGEEPATGFTLYLDSLLRAVPPAQADKTLFVPESTAAADAAKHRTAGWRTVQGLDRVKDARAEARRLGCSHVLLAGKIEKADKA
ncbi:MAG TPA: ATP phosphoribosyltransferase regulatory subunit [Candidatus Cybelea sp.]|nr:ATP phosphoribosyltransferase regulatory subunit [Candidatus Cybelea sp.]